MRLHYVIDQLYFQPALITAQGHAAVRMFIESLLDTSAERRGTVCGEEVDLPQMQIENGLAQIPIGGPIGTRLGLSQKGRGAVDTQDVMEEIEQAEADPRVKNILFVFDSPGGIVTGTPELADRIRAISKPKFSYAYNAHSAAYWLASATDRIFTTPTGGLGSIGVYLPIVDESRAFEQQGVKVELIKAGRLKGAGFPGTTLSDAQRANLQAEVNNIYEMFKGAVMEKRKKVTDETMQGQSFMGQKAIDAGLADELISIKSLIKTLSV